MKHEEGTRLNKFISESGLCSRREADRYIERGNVFINGQRAKVGDQVFVGDKVMCNGHKIDPKTEENLILLAFNKPIGITSTTELSVKDNIIDFVNYSERIFPIGRLDKDSSGLIFLTNNGDLVNKILRAGNKHEKEYLVTVNKPITEDFLFGMSNGVPILDVVTKKCKVKQVSTFVFSITLIQGLNRQIRRMCEYFDYQVTKLERVRIMHISIKGLAIGDFRELSADELAILMKSVAKSSSEVEKKPKKNTATDQNNKNKAPKSVYWGKRDIDWGNDKSKTKGKGNKTFGKDAPTTHIKTAKGKTTGKPQAKSGRKPAGIKPTSPRHKRR